MGRNHYRVLSEDPRFELLAVVDPVLESLPVQGRPLPLLRDLKSALALDFTLAVVAAPTELHATLVRDLLEAGRHVFVEKPAASTETEARQLVELAEARGLALAVGNIERCNPVVQALREVVQSQILGRIVHIHGLRAGGFPRNVKTGNNVILDLAVHELDVFRMLLGPMDILHSLAHATKQLGIYDAAEIIVRSAQGASGTVHVNWLTPQRLRTIRVTGDAGVAHVDYLAQTLELVGFELNERASQAFPTLEWQRDAQGLERAQLPIISQESLKNQLQQLYCYLTGQAHHLAIGEELVESVQLVADAVRLADEAWILGRSRSEMEQVNL
jgi:UDP-N-acetylglucosamine 3-dehydrogenase